MEQERFLETGADEAAEAMAQTPIVYDEVQAGPGSDAAVSGEVAMPTTPSKRGEPIIPQSHTETVGDMTFVILPGPVARISAAKSPKKGRG